MVSCASAVNELIGRRAALPPNCASRQTQTVSRSAHRSLLQRSRHTTPGRAKRSSTRGDWCRREPAAPRLRRDLLCGWDEHLGWAADFPPLRRTRGTATSGLAIVAAYASANSHRAHLRRPRAKE